MVCRPTWKAAEAKPVSWRWPICRAMRDFQSENGFSGQPNTKSSMYAPILDKGPLLGSSGTCFRESATLLLRLRESSTWGYLGTRHGQLRKSFEDFVFTTARALASLHEKEITRPN
jgi:hypothetical protein